MSFSSLLGKRLNISLGLLVCIAQLHVDSRALLPTQFQDSGKIDPSIVICCRVER